MKQIVLVAASTLLGSCTMHFHFHEPLPPAAPQTAATQRSTSHAAPSNARHGAAWPAEHGTVEGVVVDLAGNPTRAHIAAVCEGGSITMSTDDRGRFEIRIPSDEFVLHASTKDGRIALERGNPADGSVELGLRPGGTLVIDMEGRAATRCAVFAQHLRTEDFTLHAGRTCRVVVPAGGVRVRLYEGDEVFAERNFDIQVGESKAASFKLDA